MDYIDPNEAGLSETETSAMLHPDSLRDAEGVDLSLSMVLLERSVEELIRDAGLQATAIYKLQVSLGSVSI